MTHELVGGRFRIGRVIGRGNMGEVHQAEDLEASEGTPERTVAVKTILRRRTGIRIDTGGDTKAVERFAREVTIMRRLDHHPNITRLIAGGIAADREGLPYLAMELLDGRSLRDLIEEESQLPIVWAAAIAAQIAGGLATAHAQGVVHRDLKPANVMLTRGGTVKVLDFGMGSIVDDPDQTRLTSTGVSVGTARYMARNSARPSRCPRPPTSTRWAVCCTRCWSAFRRSRASPRSSWPSDMCTMTRLPSAGSVTRSLRSSPASWTGCWPRTPRTARPTP